MHAHLPLQIILVSRLVALHCQGRPTSRDCGRVFSFDFDKEPVKTGAGGIWQGQDGEVTYRDGKAWLDGRGSLTYPFFSQNDLRTGFALSFKVKPTKLGVSGRVAIITNGLTPGTSTLTIFHNETCVGVKVVEIADRWPRTRGYNRSRQVELSVDYTKHAQRVKRSESNAPQDGQTVPDITHDDEGVISLVGNRSGVSPPNNSHPNFGEYTGIQSSTSGPEDYSDQGGVKPGNAVQEEAGDDITHTSKEVPSKDTIIAVRRLYKDTRRFSTTTSVVVDPRKVYLQRETTGFKQTRETTGSKETVGVEHVISNSSADDSPPKDEIDSSVKHESSDDKPTYYEDETSLPEIEETTPKTVTAATSTIPAVVVDSTLRDWSFTLPPRPTKVSGPWTNPSNRHKLLVVPNIFKGIKDEDPEEIEVRLAQDKNVISFQVGDSAVQSTAIAATEHMKAPRSALRVGVGDGLEPYRGSFDDFVMYDCTPENFFKEED